MDNQDPILQASFSPFTYAVSIGDDKTVQFLLETGANPEEEDAIGNSSLCLAIQNGHLKTAAYLVEFGADIYRRDRAGNVPVELAKAGQDAQMANLIAGVPAPLVVPEPVYEPAEVKTVPGRVRPAASRSMPIIASIVLYTIGISLVIGCFWLRATYKYRESQSIVDAVNASDVEQVGRLLTSGISANISDMSGNALLSYAARNGKGEVVRILLGNHADPNLTDPRGLTIIASALYHKEIIQNLLDSGANPNREDEAHRTIMSYACLSADNSQIITDLLKHRANPNVAGFNGPPLATLVESERVLNEEPLSPDYHDAVNALTTAAANPEITDSAGCPVVVWAAQYSDLRVVSDLIKAGASSNSRDKTGRSPLHAAAARANSAIMALLITSGADVNAEDQDGNTPLFYAVASAIDSDREAAAAAAIQLLKQHGARTDRRNSHGEFARDIARAHGLTRLAALLGS
jgi:ankyrin repeat protein